MNGKSVLYIEDNFENRLLVKRTLEAEGYSVLEAVDGPSGLKTAAESRPDLILLDISLPEVDGYDLARRFADFPHLDGVPVLAVTANVMKGDRERALGAGCDGYIPKPINIDRLPGQIEAALLRARSIQKSPEVSEEEPIPVPDDVETVPSLQVEDLAAPVGQEIDWSDIFEGQAVWSSEVLAGDQEAEALAVGSDEDKVFRGIAGDDGGGLDALGEHPVETMEIGFGEAEPVGIDVLASGGEEVSDGEAAVEVGREVVRDLARDGEAVDDEAPIDDLDRRLVELLEARPVQPESADEAVVTIADEAVADEAEADMRRQAPVDAPSREARGVFDLVGEPGVGAPEVHPVVEEAVEAEMLATRDQDAIEEGTAPEPSETAVDTEVADEIFELRLPEASLTELAGYMRELSVELGAEAVLLARGDTVLASVGQMPARKMEQLTEVLARGFRAADSVASLLGCEQGCSEQITCIGDSLLHGLAVEADLVILTAVRDSVPLGAVRLWVKRSAARVKEVVREAGGISPG